MKEMLAECERDIAVINKKLKELRKQPETARRDFIIKQYEVMLYDVLGKAAQIRKYMEAKEMKK